MSRIVQKYGGTSVGDIDRIKNVANRIKAGGKSSLDTLADSVLSGTMTPHAAASRLLED